MIGFVGGPGRIGGRRRRPGRAAASDEERRVLSAFDRGRPLVRRGMAVADTLAFLLLAVLSAVYFRLTRSWGTT